MGVNFRMTDEINPDQYDWGVGRWISHPGSTGAKQLTALDGIIRPGKGHDFHKHPDQEELLLIIAGKAEQWIEKERRILGPGDAVFIPKGVVHATFTVGAEDCRVTVVFSPSKGDYGFESTDVSGESPWNSLRK